MQRLEKAGIPTHFIEEINDRETLVKKVSIVPLEVIIRNIAAGSFSKRYGVEEGLVFESPTIEFSYKNDDLGDPLLNTYHALAMKLATKEEIETIEKYAFGVNERLKAGKNVVSHSSTLSWNSEDFPTVQLCLPMKSVRIHVVFGILKQEKNLIKTDSVATLAVWKTLIRKL